MVEDDCRDELFLCYCIKLSRRKTSVVDDDDTLYDVMPRRRRSLIVVGRVVSRPSAVEHLTTVNKTRHARILREDASNDIDIVVVVGNVKTLLCLHTTPWYRVSTVLVVASLASR
jgi:hypothetical protein